MTSSVSSVSWVSAGPPVAVDGLLEHQRLQEPRSRIHVQPMPLGAIPDAETLIRQVERGGGADCALEERAGRFVLVHRPDPAENFQWETEFRKPIKEEIENVMLRQPIFAGGETKLAGIWLVDTPYLAVVAWNDKHRMALPIVGLGSSLRPLDRYLSQLSEAVSAAPSRPGASSSPPSNPPVPA
ncbi:MAG: hypothetical protein WDO70_02090 [Alphaproteobacteria bacterium]